jgi:hypothetical protein
MLRWPTKRRLARKRSLSRGQILPDRESLTVRAPKGNFDGGKKKVSFVAFVDLKLETNVSVLARK